MVYDVTGRVEQTMTARVEVPTLRIVTIVGLGTLEWP